MSALTGDDLRQHVMAAMRQAPDARAYGFHMPQDVALPDCLEVDGRACRVLQTRSELAIRAALGEESDAGALVVLTGLKTRELGLDVRSRLARQSLFDIDPWEAVRALFKASRLDGRLRGQRALGRGLLRCAGGFSPVRSGLLDEDRAWMTMMEHGLGYGGEALSLSGLLEWACREPAQARRLRGVYPELLDELGSYAARSVGESVGFFAALLRSAPEAVDPGQHLMALGLGLEAAQKARESGEAALVKEAEHFEIRLEEAFEALTPANKRHAPAFAQTCRWVWRRCAKEAPKVLHGIVAELDGLLGGKRALALAPLSDFSRIGWSMRLARLARSLDSPGEGAELVEALEAVRRHEEAATRPEAMRRLEAAAQLAYRMATLDAETERAMSSVEEWARWYVDQGSFEDVLRERLIGADPGPEVSDALRRALGRVTERRRGQQRRFAGLMAERLQSGISGGALDVHRVLDEIIAPLARKQRVLLIVLDGMSWSVARELLRDPAMGAWVPWVPSRRGEPTPMLAAVPSITQMSRSSLLTGLLQPGDQQVERRGFEGHLPLREAISPRSARLFHKAALSAEGAGGVGPEVRAALSDPGVRVTAVVINAIDDQLHGAEQIVFDWTVERISPLRSLLELAGDDCVVVLAGDHGHLRESGSAQPSGVSATSARWRPDSDTQVEGETRVGGARIKALTGESSVLVAHDEGLRYCRASRGYHGGVSLQEIVTPLIALTRHDVDLSEQSFQQLVTSPPDWWRLKKEAAPLRIEAPAPRPEPTLASMKDQLSLLAAAPQKPACEPWIEALLASQAYRAQVERMALPVGDDEVARVLSTLGRNGGRVHIGALARALGRTESRVKRLLSALRTLLNLDGYNILAFKRAEDSLELDMALLRRQFGLSGEG